MPLTATTKPYNEAHKSLRGWCIWWVHLGASLKSIGGKSFDCINLDTETTPACTMSAYMNHITLM